MLPTTPLARRSRRAVVAAIFVSVAGTVPLAGCGDTPAPDPNHQGLGAVPEPSIEWRPERYVSYRSEVPLRLDGRLDERRWQSANWTRDFVDIEGDSRPPPRFRTRAKMLWDSTYFYIGAEMEEPHVWGSLTERDAVIYLDPDFEVFIDPDGDTHNYYELEVNALGTEWDLLLVKPYRDGGPAINAWDIQGLETAVFIDGTLNDPRDIDRGWSIEIAIPWAVLGQATEMASPPAAGDQWRVNFSRVAWRTRVENGQYKKIMDPPAGRSRPEDNWVWSPQGLINMHYPEMWGIVQFASSLAGDRVDRHVADSRDEAKWALRQIYYRQRTRFDSLGTFSTSLAELGLGGLTAAGYTSPEITVTPGLFEAWFTQSDGNRLRIRQDGLVW